MGTLIEDLRGEAAERAREDAEFQQRREERAAEDETKAQRLDREGCRAALQNLTDRDPVGLLKPITREQAQERGAGIALGRFRSAWECRLAGLRWFVVRHDHAYQPSNRPYAEVYVLGRAGWVLVKDRKALADAVLS